MFTQTLLNVAVLVYFSVSSGHGIDFNLHAGKNSSPNIEEIDFNPHAGRDFPLIVDEKVVIREDSLSEKLGLETFARPDEEIVALQSSASGLTSAFAMGEQIKEQIPNKLPNINKWKDKFIVTWDESGGFYFDRTYHPGAADPPSDQTQVITFNVGVYR